MRSFSKMPYLQCNNETNRTGVSVAASLLSTVLSVQTAVDGGGGALVWRNCMCI